METLQATLDALHSAKKRQQVDAALRTLEDEALLDALNHSHRPTLRAVFERYHQAPTSDQGGHIRAAVLRLLGRIAHPDDIDIFIHSVTAYYPPYAAQRDQLQLLRAAGLRALLQVDFKRACLHATRLLDDAATGLSGEPALTAVHVLADAGETLPLYALLCFGQAPEEVLEAAFMALPDDFPVELLVTLGERHLTEVRPVVASGIIAAFLKRDSAALHETVEALVRETQHSELRSYALVLMATSRQATLVERVYQLARLCKRDQVPEYLHAIELTTHAERDAMATLLRKRL
jgi:hypothetical protein